mmetsp:Transcript_21648/g.59483  ORF Transcript_21648/g.59483 Transcript_21648/m.59483 type:complete len:88 (+) Transcript_21648:459-722(+)
MVTIWMGIHSAAQSHCNDGGVGSTAAKFVYFDLLVTQNLDLNAPKTHVGVATVLCSRAFARRDIVTPTKLSTRLAGHKEHDGEERPR